MSASAPLGRPSRKTGSVDAVCTSATSTGLVVSVVISQAAATSFIHIVTLAASQAVQSMRNTGVAKGASAEVECAGSAAASAGSGAGSVVTGQVSCQNGGMKKPRTEAGLFIRNGDASIALEC